MSVSVSVFFIPAVFVNNLSKDNTVPVKVIKFLQSNRII